MRADFVLLIASKDRKGIVAAVANSLVSQDCNIAESAQFGDVSTDRFFMRIAFTAPTGMTSANFTDAFMPVATAFRLDWHIHDLRQKIRAMIMVSQGGIASTISCTAHRPGGCRWMLPASCPTT